ncbi:DUF2206 domain-containing protein [Methanobacterium sp.]|uniref:DUF2206 domain-containing protein n=1 Tax=Methanobacterium sp. TaxID=2164 RepID=UPI003C75CC4C
MLDKINNFGIKKWLVTLISILFITDIIILLDVPFLREFMTFVSFTTIPGILILHVLKLNKIEFVKKIVLLVGLSVAFLIFMGLLLNSLYPIILKPLSLMPVLILSNVILIILAFIAYIRNKNDFNLNNFLNLNINLKGKLVSPLIFPALFPFMAVFGTYLMNLTQNNFILLLMLILIPVYIVIITLLKDRIHDATYPFALWTIALSLLLMHGLTSSYLMGRDVHYEYYSFQLALQSFHWDINTYLNPYNACLSITILPTILQSLSNLNGEYIFKIFSLIGSFIPLVVYIVSKKYLENKYAFFAGLLFSFQLFFVYLLGAVRQEIAILFFFLAIMILFTADVSKTIKKILFVIFMVSVVVSHYTTAYVSFILILPILLMPFFKGLFIDKKLKFTNFDVIILLFLFILAWYLLFGKVQANAGSQVLQSTIAGSGDRGDYVLGVLGIVLKSVPNTISVIVHDLIFVTIGIGLLTILRNYKKFIKQMDPEYIVVIFVSIILLVMFLVLPYISVAYDAVRLFFQLLIFLAPVFIIGAMKIAKIIKRPKWDILIVLVLLISLFSCATYLQYHFYGEPYSPDYDSNGLVRNEAYIYNQEVIGATWLKDNYMNNYTTYSEGRGLIVFLTAYGSGGTNMNLNNSLFSWNKTVDEGYIYLGYLNVNKNKVQPVYTNLNMQNMSNYSNLFLRKSKIYDNGGSQIWL